MEDEGESSNAPGEIASVRLLGSSGALQFTRGASGLMITLPERVGDRAVPLYALAIEGRGLR